MSGPGNGFVDVFDFDGNLVLRLVPIKADREGVTEEEITVMLREGTAAGRFHAVETGIVQMASQRMGATLGGIGVISARSSHERPPDCR